MKFTVPSEQVEPLMRRMFFLAWKACGGPVGMGILQDRGPIETEEDVWGNIQTAADYTSNHHIKPGQVYADYVFGRMMKMGVKYGAENADTGFIETRDGDLSPDYESWCEKYPSYEALAQAAAAELGINVSVQPAVPN